MRRAAFTAILVFLILGGCSSSERNGPEDSASSDSFEQDLADLCAETAAVEDRAISGNDIDENLDRVATSHRELEAALVHLEPPAEKAESFDAYLAELSVFVDAMELGYGDAQDSHGRLEALVDNARSAVELKELAEPAGIPEECPPGADSSVHNTLFVTEVNLGCFELGDDLLVAGPIAPPKSAKGISLVLDLGKRVSAGIAQVIRRAASPEVDDRIPVRELIQANKKRFLAVEDLADTFRTADFDAYKQAASRLKTISRSADRLALSVGLVE